MLDNIVFAVFGYLSDFLTMVAQNWFFSLIFIIWFITMVIDFFMPDGRLFHHKKDKGEN